MSKYCRLTAQKFDLKQLLHAEDHVIALIQEELGCYNCCEEWALDLIF